VPSPVKRANRYEQLWHHANPVLPRGLPRQWHDFNLITFDAEWNPQGHSFVYLEPVARFFVSSGLEVPASLPAFLARHAALLNQDAGLPVTLNLRAGIMAATVWVAPLGALGIYLAAIAADKSAQEAADLRDDCTRKATEIREFLADPTDTDESAEYWADKIERMRAALDEPNALFCMTIDEATQAREQFPAIVARDVTDRYPAWEANVRSNTETADAVTHALTRSGDRNLLLQWQQRSTELVREAMESLVSYDPSRTRRLRRIRDQWHRARACTRLVAFFCRWSGAELGSSVKRRIIRGGVALGAQDGEARGLCRACQIWRS
jgi:hypothetical protein